MTFDEPAATLASRVKASGRGFLTMRREELREAFEIGKLTEGQANSICEALGRHEVFIYPHPYGSGPTLRLYDQKHPLAALAEAVVNPDSIPEAPLRRASEVFARESAARNLRSDDAPWIGAFEIFLLVASGREPEGWEDLREDRHPSELARELAEALGFPQELATLPSTLHLAAAVCGFRPHRRHWQVQHLTTPPDSEAAVLPMIDALTAANRRLREEHDRLLRQAARLFRHSEEIPDSPVELGLLGLRYRREDASAGSAP